jgi:hypothetical protein
MFYLFSLGSDNLKRAIPFSSSIDDMTDQMNRNTMTRLMVLWAMLRCAVELVNLLDE